MGPIVFLHNTLASKMLYDPLLGLLPGVQAHALDFRAHGARVHEARRFRAEDLVRDVQDYADAQRLERFNVVGASLGATVAVLLAHAWPERVEKIVLSAFTSDGASPFESLQASAIAAAVGVFGPRPAFVSAAMRRLFAASQARDQRAWREHLSALPARAIRASLLAWRDRPDLSALLPALRVPALFIAGEEDVASPPRLAERACARMPNASLVHLAASGHMAPYEQPERFAEILHAFLRDRATSIA